jgi:hypothetical protein
MGRFSNLEFEGKDPLREESRAPGELRAAIDRTTWAARSSGRTPASAPAYRPNGVRTASST